MKSLEDPSIPLATRLRHADLIARMQALEILHRAALRGSVTACIAVLRAGGHFRKRPAR